MLKIALVALAITASAISMANAKTAGAELKGLDGKTLGNVAFQSTASGMLVLTIDLKGLPAGPHAFHVHETGTCDASDGFKSAGGHLAAGKAHGVGHENGPHPGDFPNIHVPEAGAIKVEYFTRDLTLDDSETGVFDADGAAVVMHDGPDDYVSQPAGAAGKRIVCGVIVRK